MSQHDPLDNMDKEPLIVVPVSTDCSLCRMHINVIFRKILLMNVYICRFYGSTFPFNGM